MRRGPRTAEQLARENAQARARRAAGYVRPPRSEREKEQSRDRARVRGRVKLGWSASRLADTPAVRVARTRRSYLDYHPSYVPSPPVELVPIAVGHPLFERARSLLRSWEREELSGDMDSVAADLIGEYVLAELEGRDGEEAMSLFRSGRSKDRSVLVYGTVMTDGLER